MIHAVVIGLGNFGMNVARKLVERGCDVLAIDRDPALVEEAAEFCAQATNLDVRERANLEPLGVEDMDIAFVCIGEEMESSLLATLYLSELKLARVIAEAASREHELVLRRLGASEIVYPERDAAFTLVERLVSAGGEDEVPGGGRGGAEGRVVFEIEAGEKLAGRTIEEAVTIANGEGAHPWVVALLLPPGEGPGAARLVNPPPDTVLGRGVVLVLVAREEERAHLLDEEGPWK